MFKDIYGDSENNPFTSNQIPKTPALSIFTSMNEKAAPPPDDHSSEFISFGAPEMEDINSLFKEVMEDLSFEKPMLPKKCKAALKSKQP